MINAHLLGLVVIGFVGLILGWLVGYSVGYDDGERDTLSQREGNEETS